VWEVYRATGDLDFLREMYPAIEAFHGFWYAHRDVRGVGLCSWTEGMESGMDDGVRFLPEFAHGVRNQSTQVNALDFWSIDLNSYLYLDKRVLALAADKLGNSSAAAAWSASADALRSRLQQVFYVADSGSADSGFFQDRYMNGTAVPVQGCEGYAALFAEVASAPQAAAMARVLADERRFLANFSLPTVSRADRHYQPRGYWKGSTWLDQTWFAYAGLLSYSRQPGLDHLSALAAEIKRRMFALGKGFRAPDPTPLNEHYEPESGAPLGAAHFGWTSAHVVLWATEGELGSSWAFTAAPSSRLARSEPRWHRHAVAASA